MEFHKLVYARDGYILGFSVDHKARRITVYTSKPLHGVKAVNLPVERLIIALDEAADEMFVEEQK